MTDSIILRTELDNVEFFTVQETGDSGMSQSGLAKLCGVNESSLRTLFDNLRDNKSSKWLEPCLGKELHLRVNYQKQGGAVKIVKAEICSAIIKHYAFSGNETAQYALDKFTTLGINTWIQGINQWKPVEKVLTPCEQLLFQAQRMVELEYRQIKLEQEQAEQKSLNQKLIDEQKFHDMQLDHHTGEIIGLKAELGRYGNGTGSHYTILAWATILGIKNITLPEASKLGKKASKLCRQLKIQTGKTRDVRFGVIKTYPEFVLNQVDFAATA